MATPVTAPTGLVQAMGRGTLTALIINSIVGSGIFGLPSVVAGYLGQSSPFAYVIGAAGVAVIVACFAEVASQFNTSGGPYLYARESFGRFVGIETGWLLCLSRVTAAAAALNLFTSYFAEFFPPAKEPVPRLLILTLLVGFLAFVNYRGVRPGAATSNIFTIAKLSVLLLFAAAGAAFLLHARPPIQPTLTAASAIPLRNWFAALTVVMFAYGGFEGAVVPMAEAKNPRRDAPFALFGALATAALLYCMIQYVVDGVLPAAAAAERPLATAARMMWGGWGAKFITLGALTSLYGYLSAQMLHSPRLLFALGEQGDFPPLFSRVHSRFRTPHISIVIFALVVWILAALGNFKWNVIISSVARLFVYVLVCAALPVLRRKRPSAAAFRVRAGDLVAAIGVLFMLLFMSRMGPGEWIAILMTMSIALVNWCWARGRITGPAVSL